MPAQTIEETARRRALRERRRREKVRRRLFRALLWPITHTQSAIRSAREDDSGPDFTHLNNWVVILLLVMIFLGAFTLMVGLFGVTTENGMPMWHLLAGGMGVLYLGGIPIAFERSGYE